MRDRTAANRLIEKSTLHAIQVELQQGYSLSPIEVMALARRLEEMIDEQTGSSRKQGQITYQAIDMDEPAGKPLSLCRKVPVHLTVVAGDRRRAGGRRGNGAHPCEQHLEQAAPGQPYPGHPFLPCGRA